MLRAEKYFPYIEKHLDSFIFSVKRKGRLNDLGFHLNAEDLFKHLLNKIYDWELDNANRKIQNNEGFDLIDSTNKIVIQVSATTKKEKIKDSLSKSINSKLSEEGYTFKFLFLTDSATSLKKEKVYSNPYNVSFNANRDILDITDIIRDIKGSNIEKITEIHSLIEKEFDESELNESKLNQEIHIRRIVNWLEKVEEIKIKYYDHSDDWVKKYSILQELSKMPESLRDDILSVEILHFLHSISQKTYYGMPPNIAEFIYWTVCSCYPFEKQSSQDEYGFIGISIGFNLIYDSILNVSEEKIKYKIATWGFQIFKYLYYKSYAYDSIDMRDSIEMRDEIMNSYKHLEILFSKNKLGLELLNCYKNDLNERSFASPIFPKHLAELIITH